MSLNYELLDRSVEIVRKAFAGVRPKAGLILGSGLSPIVTAFTRRGSLSYEELPALGAPGVAGHAGELVWGELCGIETLIFCGRRHWYEGLGWTPVAFPIFLLKRLKAANIVVTNAAGGIAAKCRPGEIMMVRGHINLMGSNPLIGAVHEVWGARFPDMTNAFDKGLQDALLSACAELAEPLQQGVFVATSGPAYETAAEIQFFAKAGASAVGMSLVPEVTLARAAGIKALGVSCITNLAAGISSSELTHQEVTETTKSIIPRLRKIMPVFFSKIPD